MRTYFFLLWLGIMASHAALGQSPYYFPPTGSAQWDTLSPQQLGWCEDSLNSLYAFLEEKNTKAFLVLKEGKMVIERYFDDFQATDNWYWASAGKSLAAFLVGMAQDQQLLSIEDSVSRFLGQGWTSLPPAQERNIKIRHQITMTTGLADTVDDLNCLDPSCLTYQAEPGTRWSYHNAPYRLVQDVVGQASGGSMQSFTKSQLLDKIGMNGLWFNYVFWSTPRSMARFGLLCLNQGIWDQDTLLKDTAYFQAMSTSSQPHNPSYGYLWWLNGQGQYMIPSLQFLFSTDLVPSAPADMYAGLGKNDQKVYVVPSQDLVVVRMGNDGGGNLFALSSFDENLWSKMAGLACQATSIEVDLPLLSLYPNPAKGAIFLKNLPPGLGQYHIYSLLGQAVKTGALPQAEISLSGLQPGWYLLKVEHDGLKRPWQWKIQVKE
ncbi:MAG: serine hydrolase [Bacteroidota bacterium]